MAGVAGWISISFTSRAGALAGSDPERRRGSLAVRLERGAARHA